MIRSTKFLSFVGILGCLSLAVVPAFATEPQAAEKATEVEKSEIKKTEEKVVVEAESKKTPLTLEALKESIDGNAAKNSEAEPKRARFSPAQGNPSKQ